MGAVNSDSRDFFILLNVLSFQDIFPVMREWENKMFQDLHGFFGYELNSETSYLLTKDFEDGIVQNKNARILYEMDGPPAFFYVFLNETHVLITNTEGATREIILRLFGSEQKR